MAQKPLNHSLTLDELRLANTLRIRGLTLDAIFIPQHLSDEITRELNRVTTALGCRSADVDYKPSAIAQALANIMIEADALASVLRVDIAAAIRRRFDYEQHVRDVLHHKQEERERELQKNRELFDRVLDDWDNE